MTEDGMNPYSDPSRCMLVLNAPPALEDSLVDWLLESEAAGAFTSIACAGHGADPEHLSLAEQVIGRQRGVQFEVIIDRSHLTGLLAEAQARFAATDIYYRVLPVFMDGHL